MQFRRSLQDYGFRASCCAVWRIGQLVVRDLAALREIMGKGVTATRQRHTESLRFDSFPTAPNCPFHTTPTVFPSSGITRAPTPQTLLSACCCSLTFRWVGCCSCGSGFPVLPKEQAATIRDKVRPSEAGPAGKQTRAVPNAERFPSRKILDVPVYNARSQGKAREEDSSMKARIALYCVLGGLPLLFGALGTGGFQWWWLSGVVLAAAFVPVALFGPREALELPKAPALFF